jgi:uncharacterized membrane protein
MGVTIFVLLVLALILLFAVCGQKGSRSLLSLGLTIIVLLLVVIPLIMRGYDPVLVTFLAAWPITALVVYFTEGWSVLSHLSIIGIIINFLLVALLADLAVVWGHFNGIISEAASLVGGEIGLNLPALLTAGIMLGTLGAIIEMVVTQVATVEQFIQANPAADRPTVYQQAYRVGVTHLGSIINTLFLIYAGILLPLLIMFAGRSIRPCITSLCPAKSFEL